MRRGGEFYSEGDIPVEETDRLQRLEYPSVVSVSLLDGLDLDDKRVLDAGAGANTDLARYVEQRGGMYVPLDIVAVMLQKQKEALANPESPYLGAVGSVKDLPFQDRSIDIFHQRFVLMNIDPDSRERVVREALRVSREAALFLEYNWATFTSTQDQTRVDQIKEAAFDFFSRFSTDPYMGTKFSELFENAAPGVDYQLKNFRRQESVEHLKELSPLLATFHQVSSTRLNDEALADRFKSLEDSLVESPISFVPPEIVAAIVRK